MQKYGWDTREHAIIKRLDGVMYPDWIIGDYYLATEVEAALAEKEENWNKIVEVWQMKLNTQNDQIASLLKKLERSNDAWISGQEQIAGMRENKLYLENNLAMKRGQIASLTESCNYWRRLWRLTEAAERKAGEEIAALKAENKRLEDRLLGGERCDCDTAQAAIKEEQRITLIDDLGAANGKIAKLTERLSQTVSCVDYKQQACTLCTTLIAENERLRQIVTNCYAGWPDEVLQKALRGEEDTDE